MMLYRGCRLSLRDADSEMSERTKQLLLSRISTFAFAKKIRLDGMDAKKREEELAKKYIEKWRFRWEEIEILW